MVLVPLSAGIATACLLLREDLPLGIQGEWVWNRSPQWPPLANFLVPFLVLCLYLAFLCLGRYLLHRTRWHIAWLLLALVCMSGIWQWTALEVPSPPLGVERWPMSIFYPATSGYFTIATEIEDLPEFLRSYDQWITQQDNFHIGTHPPGLIVTYCLLLQSFERHPDVADWLIENAPQRLGSGLALLSETSRLGPAEHATLIAASLGTWLIYLLTIFPVYALARLECSPSSSWLAASTWGILPAGLLFLPVSDCLFPLIAGVTVWLMLLAPTRRFAVLAIPAGFLFGLGLCFSLAFLTVLPLVFVGRALIARRLEKGGFKRSMVGCVVFSLTFLGLVLWGWLSGIDLVSIWRTNLSKHAGFYEAMPRSYWPWIFVNLLEFGISSGPIFFVLSLLALASRRDPETSAPSEALKILGGVWLATLLCLDLSGRNLSEVARLWILLIPFGSALIARLRPDCWPARRLLLLWGTAAAVTLLLIGGVEPLLPVHPDLP